MSGASLCMGVCVLELLTYLLTYSANSSSALYSAMIIAKVTILLTDAIQLVFGRHDKWQEKD